VSKSTTVNVRVNRRILWVGTEAYPLQNIARARTVRLAPKRGPAVGRFIAAIGLWIALEVGDAAVLRAARVPGSIRATLVGYIEIGAAGLIALSMIGLLVALARRTLYALVIETAGTPVAAVVNPDGNLVNWLVQRIMEAIDNSQDAFQQTVENYYGGNHVKQFGPNSIGMVNR
jgi:hypothetical protein